MKKFAVYALVIISILALVLRFSATLVKILNLQQKSGIVVTSNPSSAIVYLNSQSVGQTPFEMEGLEAGEYLVKLEKDEALWQGSVNLNPGTVTIINRDLAKDFSSSGYTLTLKRGQGITVISNPNNARVMIDGKVMGNTPINADIPSGEHTTSIDHPNYLNRSVRAILPEGFDLVILVDLALSEANLSTISTPVIKTTPEVAVKTTPTGFLRVRDKPSLSGKEISQVKPGDILTVLEEQGNWARVRLPDGVEGFVSAIYIEKKAP